MNPEWLCYVNGQEYGPYTWPQLVQMAAAGNVTPQTHVRRNFDSQWYLAEQVPGLFSPAAGGANPKQAAHPTSPPRTAATKKSVSKSGAQPAVAARPAAALLPEPAAPMQAPMAPVQTAAPVQPAVPKGRVVSAASTAVASAADTRPQWIPVNPTATPASAAPVALQSETDGAPVPGKKKDDSKQLVLYSGVAIVAVALLGGAALIWKFTRPPEVPKEVVAAPVIVPTDESDPNVISEESNGTAEVNPADVVETKAAAKTATKPGAPKAEATPKKVETTATASPAAGLVKSVKSWKQIEKFGKVGAKSGLTCTKLSAYLAADETGRRVSLKSEGGAPAAAPADNNAAAAVAPGTDANAEGTPPIAAPLTTQPAATGKLVAAEPAPFLIVEMTITNGGTAPLAYGGWNHGTTSAVLVDAAGKPYTLVPASSTPKILRQPAGKEVKPGEAIQDTLVFAVPPASDLQFRLVLPQTAFSAKLPGTWGYEIGPVALAGPPAQIVGGNPAAPGEAPLPQVRSSTTIPIPGLQDPPAPIPQPAPAQPAPAQPAAEPEMKKPAPTERIPIPGLEPDTKPAGPKIAEEVPNLNPPQPKKKP